jgi:MoaA/NifB/PqqE/SkfB family radical SAM enzyme
MGYLHWAKNPLVKATYATIPVLRAYNGLSQKPLNIEIHPTFKCTQACPDCFYKGVAKKLSIDKELMINTLGELRDIGVPTIEFSGAGNPTDHNDFPEFIKFSKDKFATGIKTNGIYTAEVGDAIAKIPVGYVRFSLDAATPKTFKKVRGSDRFHEVCVNMRRLVKSRREGLNVGIGFVVKKENVKEAQAVLDLADDIGVDYVDFRPNIEHMEYCKERLKPKKIHSKCENNADTFMENLQYPVIHDPKCRIRSITAVIGADSKVYQCCQKAYRNRPLGDLKKSTFKQIWDKSVKERTAIVDTKGCPPCKADEFNSTIEPIILDFEEYFFGSLKNESFYERLKNI